MKTYSIYTVGRSGSTWLSKLMTEVGMGQPLEYFHSAFQDIHAHWWKVKNWRRPRKAMWRYLVNEYGWHGHFCAKITLPFLDVEHELIGRKAIKHAIVLRRLDTARQAISFWRAQQTNDWQVPELDVTSTELGDLPDWDVLCVTLDAIETDIKAGELELLRGISHKHQCHITYEQLMADPLGTVNAVLMFLEQEPVATIQADIKVQRDELTETILQRWKGTGEPSHAPSLPKGGDV